MFAFLQQKKESEELVAVLSSNEKTEQFGVSLTEEEAKELLLCRNDSLKKYKRIEFGKGIVESLIFTFCDSEYIEQDNYVETLEKLQDIFYAYKNEVEDKVTDEELLNFMKEQFESVCFGDTEYLESTCLERFAMAVRAGYEGYKETEGRGVYQKLSTEERWSKELYYEALRDLF